VTKIEGNTKKVVMFDRTQWVLAGMSIALWVQLSQPVAGAGRVGKVVQTAQTNSSDAAQKVYGEAEELYEQGTAEALRGAIVKYEEALKLYREAGNRSREALTLNSIGGAYLNLGENQKALDYYNQSLPLKRAIGDRGGEATTLYNIGGIYLNLGEKQKALDYYNQSLSLFRAVGSPHWEAVALNSIGLVYSDLGEKQKALEYYSQSLLLKRAIKDQRGEASILNNIGRVYSDLGEKQRALEYYNQSLPLRRAVDDHGGEAVTLSSMAFVKRSLGNFTEALTDIEASLKLIENLRSKIAGPESRSSYFATVQDYYEFYIDLLMQLHKTNPNSGYDIKASEARKRARNPKKQRIAVEKWPFRAI
jgi:tetratricopeptide (TPR) repeat protein